MATSRDELFQAALQLNETERADLIGMLLETLDTETESGVEAAWLEEIEKRIQDIDTGAVNCISWADTRSQLHRICEGVADHNDNDRTELITDSAVKCCNHGASCLRS